VSDNRNEPVCHAINRTSPIGTPFVGRCFLCGAEGLEMRDALKPCPNPGGVLQDDALLMAITQEPKP
jgi:hypothetical protein